MKRRSTTGNHGRGRLVRGLLQHLMDRGSTTLSADDLRGSAIVFSPHFDDETLGCGGTILKKRSVGAHVKILFMTDGRKSHDGWIEAERLAQLRAAEGLAAAHALGVDAEDVHLLGFEETRLAEHATTATGRVLDVLREFEPDEVYVPHSLEPPADHAMTNQVVHRAIRELGHSTVVYEYPIWLWAQWPWTRTQHAIGQRFRHVAKDQVRTNALLVRDFKHRVFVGDVLGQKRLALEKHSTQMTRMNEDPSWPILSDVADGDFLRCFFGDYEVFAQTRGN